MEPKLSLEIEELEERIAPTHFGFLVSSGASDPLGPAAKATATSDPGAWAVIVVPNATS